MYLVRIPWIVKKIYRDCIWDLPTKEKIIYLTFDDGPHPVATPFVLDLLKQYEAKATFFCIGKNVEEHGDIYRRTIEEGHAVGNHTYNHLNGWKTADTVYMEDIFRARKLIDSQLFRPPYGRVTRFQLKQLQGLRYNMKTVMWDVISGDFDTQVKGNECYLTVARHAREGSIVVFHDSAKAFERLEVALPAVLKHFSERGFQFHRIGPL